MTKNYVCCTSCLRNHTYYDLDLWCTCIKWWYSQVFLHFFQILIFGVNTGTKEQKMTWNDNYVCRIPYLSKHTSYDCVFLLHKFKMMTSPDVCFIFSKFWFSGLLGGGGNRAENGPKWQKILSHSVSQELYLIWLCFLVHMRKMMISSEFFSVFQKSDLSGFSSLSMNGKMKFWDVPHLLHLCVIFSFKSALNFIDKLFRV